MAFKMGTAGKSDCSIELDRRERKEEKQKATISSEKRYMLIAHAPLLGSALRLDICKLFWRVFFARYLENIHIFNCVSLLNILICVQ